MNSLRILINISLIILFQTSCSKAAPGIPSSCRGHIDWAFNTGKNTNPEWYASMQDRCGVSVDDATFEDFQRLFKCEEIAKTDCNDQGLQFPTTCLFHHAMFAPFHHPFPAVAK